MDFVCTEGEFKKMRNRLVTLFIFAAGFGAFSSPLFAAEKTKSPAPAPSVIPAPEVYRPMMEYSQLSEEERRILAQGPISQGQVVAGGVVGTLFGWGLGHAIQGRYSDKGWIFTVGEAVSLLAIVAAVNSCFDSNSWKDNCDSEATLAVAGYIGFFGLRIWEAVDVWAGPGSHNNRYYQLRALTEPRRVSFIATPIKSGAYAGLQFRF